MNSLFQWAIKHQVSAVALSELNAVFGLDGNDFNPTISEMVSEQSVQASVRLEASKKGMRMFRNNVGVLPDVTGRPVRFGLANDSPGVNKKIKSADLIGIRPIVITELHIGRKIGQFVSREIKHSGWTYDPTNQREVAQLAWAQLIASFGGDARFCCAPNTL